MKRVGTSSAQWPLRQVHLDFHTSPFIPDVAVEFDAREFARTFKRAHVNSVTVFAKCHHGQCYYPTRTGTAHPALKGRDLLGEQIQALHREGIRCPIYTPIVWEEDVAQKHPEWRQLARNGKFAGWSLGADMKTPQPGVWKFNNFLHPDFQDYVEAHLRELCERYGKEVDGFFLDILFFAPDACWSEASLRFREKHGLMEDNLETFHRFEATAQAAFARKFTRLVRSLRPPATVFYNTANDLNVDTRVGPRMRAPHMTHFEIESLPSGFWGYFHFPRVARGLSHWGKPWIGMTGRFQRMWGDFGGIKPQAALEYECFRSQALGGGNSVGDQLLPRGRLDAAAYELIGRVYAECERAEPFYAGSQPLPQIGILSANYPGFDPGRVGKSEEGAVQMCDELHYDSMMLDELSDLRRCPLLLLPDSTVVTDRLREQLAKFYAAGGKLLLSHRGGFDAQGRWALEFLPLTFHGEVEKYPTYWRATREFSPELSRTDRVFYEPGLNVMGGRGTQVLVRRVLPYFQRSDLKFCSHFQTPPMARADRFPAVLAGKRFIYFADPIFREYRQSGNIAARDAWAIAVQRLIGEPPFGAGLPKTILLVPRRRDKDLILTLLHYIPTRKAHDIDMIEERSSFAGEILRLPVRATRVREFGSGNELPRVAPGQFALPAVKGRLLLEVPGYFGQPA